MDSKRQNQGRRQHASVTLNDVARLAGVSPMTVSRVLNGQPNVRKSTQQAVSQAIEALGYSPNKAARSLASAKQIKIGLLYSDPASTFLSAMLLGVLEQARQSDTQVVVVECAAGFDTDTIIKQLVSDGLDGIILAPPLCDSLQAFNTLNQHNMLAVTIGSKHSEDKISSICINDYRAAYAMTQHIIALGHFRIGFIIGTIGQSSSSERLSGYRKAMEDADLDVPDELIVQGDYSYRSGFEAADQLLQLEKAPTAIIASNDDMAAGVIATAHRRGIDVPGELTVCGFDDTMLSRTMWPSITTIRQPIAEMSSTAIELLVKGIRHRRTGNVEKGQHLEMDFSLLRRESDAPIR